MGKLMEGLFPAAPYGDVTCTPDRVHDLVLAFVEGRLPELSPDDSRMASRWRSLIVHDRQIARAYARHLIDHITVYENRVMLVNRASTPEVNENGRDLVGL